MFRWAGPLILLVCLVGTAETSKPVWAVDNGAGQVPDLKQTLDYGLKARLPSEFAFIRLVVKRVEQKKLPRSMVLRTFTWARRQSDKMPFPYFQFALRSQAKKIGVEL